MRDFPQLTFHSPHRRNTSTLVYVETLTAGTLFDQLPLHSDPDTEESETDDDGDEDYAPRMFQYEETTRVLYNAALLLKCAIKNSPGMNAPWPPTSNDFTIEAARSVVPVELFNLVSWISGASEDATIESYVDIPENLAPKVLSLCQDIVYLASNGHKQTPKSLSLGLAMRHLTRSS